MALTTFADDESVLGALRAGARGYLTKDTGAQDIRTAILAVAAGEATLDPAVQHHVVAALAADTAGEGGYAQAPELPDGLTPREAEVLELIAEGLSNLEIAQRLVVSPTTVKSHINHLFAKPDCGTAHRPSTTPTASASRPHRNDRPERRHPMRPPEVLDDQLVIGAFPLSSDPKGREKRFHHGEVRDDRRRRSQRV